MVKKLLTIIAVIGLFFSVSAQNARIDALGGCNIVDDITRILRLPAYVNGFGDQVQVTGSPTAFGPAFGIKSIGRKLNVGVMANMPYGVNSSILRSNFYSEAESAIEDPAGPLLGADVLPSSFPVFPHLLFGVDLDAVTLGLDVFIEATRYKSLNEQGNDKLETSASISNFGTRLSANLELGNLIISPLFGIGFPKAKVDIESSGTTDTTITLESEKKLFINTGAELGLKVSDFNLFGGFIYTLESYQFNDRDNLSDEYKGSFIDAYLGLIANISNGLLFVTQYNLSIGNDKTINSDDDFTKLSDFFHVFRFGFEKAVSGVWIFDEVVPRAGVRYTISDFSRVNIENDGGDTISTFNFPNTSTQVQLTTGLGITKGIAAIDLAVIIGSWDGVLTGPSVISGTLTLDFGKRSGSVGSRRETKPSPSPIYESDDSDYQTEPESTDEITPTEEKDSDTDFNF